LQVKTKGAEEMCKDTNYYMREATDNNLDHSTKKGKLDLVVLRHMVRKLRMTIHTLEQPTSLSQPWLYSLEERHRRTHRLAICGPRELLEHSSLYFVGFVSGKRQSIDQRVIDELNRTDKAMLSEIIHIPGLLSYSSLELRTDNWYNLVLFSDASVKASFDDIATHRYAAYELAPSYYAWIRLHHGILPGGLASHEMLLQRTKYYTFSAMQSGPIVHERSYEA
jgi:hypothetical protein